MALQIWRALCSCSTACCSCSSRSLVSFAGKKCTAVSTLFYSMLYENRNPPGYIIVPEGDKRKIIMNLLFWVMLVRTSESKLVPSSTLHSVAGPVDMCACTYMYVKLGVHLLIRVSGLPDH